MNENHEAGGADKLMDGWQVERKSGDHRRMGRHPMIMAVPIFAVLLVVGVAGCAVDRDLPTAPSRLTTAGRLDHDALMDLARRMEERGDLPAALRFYRQAAAEDPGDASAWQEIIRLAFLFGENELARAAFLKARALAPAAPEVLIAEARFRILDDRPSSARQILSRVPVAARDAGYYRTLGLSFDLEGAHARARAAYAQGLEKTPEDAGLMINLALSLALDGNYRAANDILRRLADRPGMADPARANLALVAALAGDSRIARKLAGEKATGGDGGFYERLASLKGPDRVRALILGRLPARREEPAEQTATDNESGGLSHNLAPTLPLPLPPWTQGERHG